LLTGPDISMATPEIKASQEPREITNRTPEVVAIKSSLNEIFFNSTSIILIINDIHGKMRFPLIIDLFH